MALGDIRKDIEEHFIARWTIIGAGTGYAIHNTGARNATKTLPYIVLHIIPGASINIGLNENPTRTGTVSAMVFIDRVGGDGVAWNIAELIKQVFENQRIGNIRMFETSVYDRGAGEGKEYIYEVTTTYEVEI